MVPNDWKLCSLVDITNWSSGGTPSKSNSDYWGGDVPWISAASMRGHYYSNSKLKVTELAVNEKAKMAEKGTILLLVRGSMLWNKIPVGITSRRVAFNQDVKCISPEPKELNVTFLLYWFLAKENKLMGMVTGTGIGAGKLDTNDLQSLYVFLPPLPEQRKIATILGTWDKAISTTERLIDNSKQQKKALMQQLLTGAHTQRKRLLDDSGKPFEGEWEEVKLSDVAEVIMGSSPKSSSYNQNNEGLPLLQGNADIKNRTSVPRIYTSEVTKKCLPEDILLSVRAPVGTVAKSAHEACIGRGISSIKAKTNHVQEYLYQWLLWFEPRWEQYSQGSTFEAVNSNDIKSLHLTVPTHSEQAKIASVLSNADKEIELLAQQLADLKQEKKALMQQLLTGKRRVKVDDEALA